MSVFRQLQQQLNAQLRQLPDSREIVALTAECNIETETPFLAWLKGQTAYPHFYWQGRDSGEIIATCGAIRNFSDLAAAQKFSQQTRLPLFGGVQFHGAVHFFLPRLVLVKKAEKLTACLYLVRATDAEKQQAEQALHAMVDFSPLAELPNTCLTRGAVCDFERWQQNITQAVNAIHQGQFNKVVLANATTMTFEQPLCAYSLLAKSRHNNQGCYHFLWAENADVAFLGSSPERLYCREAGWLHTEALAGTVAASEDSEQTARNALWLLSDPKNIYENQLVVEDIYSHLQDVIEDFEVGEREIKRLVNVQHLRRRIQAEIRTGMQDSDILSRIHPTAAVAGLPRNAAIPFITEHEGFERGWYAGTLGYFSPQSAEFCVTLRSAQVNHHQITLYAGAGIVEGSSAESEWQEILRKSLAMANLLEKSS